jgi:glycosyltransferase involved in cell wall biosynthesis
MRVATIFAGVPNPWQSGATLQHWALVTALRDAGHDVVLLALPWEGDLEDEARVAAVRDLGVEVRVVDPDVPARPVASRWRARRDYARALVWPDDETLFPAVAYASATTAALLEERPDALVAHGTPAIAATYRAPFPKLALAGDPPGTSRRIRARWDPLHPWSLRREALLYRLGIATYAFRADRRIYAMLRGFDSVGIFGAHYAKLARRNGVAAWYAPSPVEDPVGPEWRERREAAPPNEKPRVLMIGHLRGVATISALHVFVDDVLPKLDAALGSDGYEVHVAGAYDPPAALRDALDHPAVFLRGHVEPPDDEFLRADCLLVPTPVPTGPRVRILTAFSYGCCVVAHEANALGIPELVDGQNVLLTGTEGLADATVRALRDPELRARLGAAGRAVYEERFTPEKAGGRIAAEVERLASARDARPVEA